MKRASGLLEFIHVDVCSPMNVGTHSVYLCFLTFTDDLSKYGDIYLIKHKSETFERFKNLIFYLPPTQFFREKLFLEKGPILSNKHLLRLDLR